MEREEIVVTVGGEVCVERSSEDVNTVSIFHSHVYLTYNSRPIVYLQYVCSPPSPPPGGPSQALAVVVGIYTYHLIIYLISPT